MTNAVLDSMTEIEQLGLIAKNGDLAVYSKAVHDWETEPYQDAWAEALDTETKLLIVCPPDTYKSSTVQCWIEQQIGLNPDIRILWLMNAGEQTQKRVMAVAETIETNSVYKAAFGVEPNYDAQWTKTALFVKRTRKGPDPTLMGCGFNGPYQGLHFDIIIIDDPTNQEDVQSPTTMERQRVKLRGVILDRLVEKGRIVAIMTRWGDDDLVPTFKEIGFKIVTMPIMGDYPWGPTISNKRFTVERCEQLRIEKTDAIFDLTYMCNPSAMSGGIIRWEHINYWDTPGAMILPETNVVTIMAVDPAATDNTWSDPSCIITAVYEPATQRLFITDVWAEKTNVERLEQEIVRRATGIRNLVAIGVETKGFQVSFLQHLRRSHNLPFRELPYRTRRQMASKVVGLDNNKTGRAIYVDSKFMAKRLFIRHNLGTVDGVSYETELCQFPYGRHDDRLDTTSFVCVLGDAYTRPVMKVKFETKSSVPSTGPKQLAQVW